ncbi:hypothetical protein BaRGS_00004736 [Batillaria attramentaria]|uniref:Laccase n=1 Tax=Batillaria attramentaria TaxID=370345 RepID=A0ABD0LWJ7_9CAEN
MGHLLLVVWRFIAGVILSAGVLTVFCSHSCLRPCVGGEEPMTCQFNFTVEWYRTLSKACWDCPFNVSDCFRPQCLSGDGYPRPVITINRQIPGPPIQVCEGDRIVVWVRNELSDGSTTSIHWHGIHQRGTPYMDGPVHITQCPIQPLETFRYDFVASPAGTHWYHSHSGLQYGDGVYGAFIVRQTETFDPHSALYDSDLPEHVMLIADWLPETSNAHFIHNMYDVSGGVGRWSALINGRASRHEVPNTYNTSGSPLGGALTPMTMFRVQENVRYRFRIISAAQKCTFLLYFDRHQMQIIATDGNPFSPVTADALHIAPGERYDVIITTIQSNASYWIGAIGHGQCKDSNGTNAILKYEGADSDYPDGEPYTFYTYKPKTELGPNPPRAGRNKTRGTRVPLAHLNSSHPVDLTDTPADVIHYVGEDDFPTIDCNKKHVTIFFAMESLQNDNSVFNDKHLYSVKSLPEHKKHLTPVMNNITFRLPPVPLLSQPEDVDEAWFCNRSTVDHSQCLNDLCRCTHRLLVRPGQMVDIVFVVLDKDIEGHPMHLHGHSFYLLAMKENDKAESLDDMEELDRQGLLPRKLINPIVKDTIKIPPDYYAILRFRADNSGIWFFHCHMEDHLTQGKAFVIQVGDNGDFPPLPDIFPRCGGWETSNAKRSSRKQSSDCQDLKTGKASMPLVCSVLLAFGLFVAVVLV